MRIKKYIASLLIASLTLSACNSNVGGSPSSVIGGKSAMNQAKAQLLANDNSKIKEINNRRSVLEKNDLVVFDNADDNTSRIIYLDVTNGLRVWDGSDAKIPNEAMDDSKSFKEFIEKNLGKFKAVSITAKPDNLYSIYFNDIDNTIHWLAYSGDKWQEFAYDVTNPELKAIVVQEASIGTKNSNSQKSISFEDSLVGGGIIIDVAYVATDLPVNADGEAQEVLIHQKYVAKVGFNTLQENATPVNIASYGETASLFQYTNIPTSGVKDFITSIAGANVKVDGAPEVEKGFWDKALTPGIIAMSLITAILGGFGFYKGYEKDLNTAKNEIKEAFKNSDVAEANKDLSYIVHKSENDINSLEPSSGVTTSFIRYGNIGELLSGHKITANSNEYDLIQHMYIENYTKAGSFQFNSGLMFLLRGDDGNTFAPAGAKWINHNKYEFDSGVKNDVKRIEIMKQLINRANENLNTLIKKGTNVDIKDPEAGKKITNALFVGKYGTSPDILREWLSNIMYERTLVGNIVEIDTSLHHGDNVYDFKITEPILDAFLQKYSKNLPLSDINNYKTSYEASKNVIIGFNETGKKLILTNIDQTLKIDSPAVTEVLKDFRDYLKNEIKHDLDNMDLLSGKGGYWKTKALVAAGIVGGVLDGGKELLINSVGCGQYFCNSGILKTMTGGKGNVEFDEVIAHDMLIENVPYDITGQKYNLRLMQNFSMTCGDMRKKLNVGPNDSIYAVDYYGNKYQISDIDRNLCYTASENRQQFVE